MNNYKEKIFKSITYIASLFTIVALFGIIFSLFTEGIPILNLIKLKDFIGSTKWHPTMYPPDFGILSLIVGSLVVTAGALVISIPLGLGSAIYISEIAGPRTKEIIKPIIELLAGIPSVVYGLFGMAFLSPFLIKVFGIPTGLNALSASIILGIMVVPIVSSMSEDALSTVPKSLREASLALGANRWETIVRVVLPAARSGVLGSIILGFGRAIGETMVVIMVAGGAAQIPTSMFDPVRPMTATIAAEMGETVFGSPHFHALFGIAVVLFIITFITNLITEFVFQKKRNQT
ncbi:MAG: phosphate ABC transporter permease subunit PstC [Candidatus Cloacimonetes bacterium]|nr:phosphate ABC transporter permease subunit PstC [Candidatus Cloacimonadota bacterium]MCF7814037.1 phosphate ABC transporter permease subunit PstC [Candidatus Cloacimonadota bacterium]MCF7868059.1 phosphate ABC transporter permease subunit PstC [Candidatus Cloacimonadota bacterium]MCF7883482.1 phosphate ABC transporter permease subunit PstC [Candidatus Cloacimonadota bacterium]